MTTLSAPDKDDLLYLYGKLLVLHAKPELTPDDLEELIKSMREEQNLEIIKVTLES